MSDVGGGQKSVFSSFLTDFSADEQGLFIPHCNWKKAPSVDYSGSFKLICQLTSHDRGRYRPEFIPITGAKIRRQQKGPNENHKNAQINQTKCHLPAELLTLSLLK